MTRNIGFLIHDMSGRGGTERVTSVIANGLSKKGYYITIISCKNGEYCEYQMNSHVQLESLHGERIKNSIIRKIKCIEKLTNIVNDKSIDLMIAVDVSLFLYLAPLKAKHLCKCVAWEHFNYYYAPNKLVKIGRFMSAKYADCVVVLGKNDYVSYQTHFKKIKRLKYIYNPVAFNMDVTADMSAKRIIAVGRLTAQKGFDLLIDAWCKIEQLVPDWRVDIFGDGELRKKLQQQIDCNELKNIRINGFTKNIEEEYLASSFFVLASRFEGFGLVLLEAQTKGLPCISFRCKEGPAEIIDNGINGYLVKEADTDDLANKILLLIQNPDKRYEFSINAKKDLYRFKVDKVINEWEMLINSI